MKRVFKHVPAIALLLTIVSMGLAGKPAKAGKPPVDTPVTSTIDGLGVDTLPTQRIQSDQAGSYKNSSSLSSIIQGIGDWELDMLNFTSSPQRKALIDLRDPVAGSLNGGAPIAPFSYQVVRARFITKCTQNGIDMRTMQPTPNVYPCPMAVAFDDASGVKYRLTENPSNFGETNWVQITCITTANAKCNQWKIEPSVTQLNGERKNVAKLLKLATNPHQSDQDMGDFYLSFTIHVTNP
jgi:hypothetical protein